MPTITGTLSDIGLAPLTGLSPVLRFTPSAPAVSREGRVFASKPVEVTPNSSGAFSVDLASTVGLIPRGTHWQLSVSFRLPSADSGGYSPTDFVPMRLHVPVDGGNIADLVEFPAGSMAGAIYVGVEPPPHDAGYRVWVDISGDTPKWKRWR